MPIKKDLADLRSEAPPPLRRGRGLRLSRAAKQSKELAATPPAKPAAVPAESAAPALESPQAEFEPNREARTPAEPKQLKPLREKRKLKLRKDLLKECKRLARAQ